MEPGSKATTDTLTQVYTPQHRIDRAAPQPTSRNPPRPPHQASDAAYSINDPHEAMADHQLDAPRNVDEPMASEPALVEITAECLCKSHVFRTTVSRSSLPLSANVCHCTSCRHSTGALYVVETTWPQPRAAVNLDGLHAYRFSDNITYRFCGTCSTLLFYESRRFLSKLGVFGGTLRNVDVDLLRFARHIYVGDTRDGGASVWLRGMNGDGREIPMYLERDGDEIPGEWLTSSPMTAPSKEPVPLYCHCRGVQLLVHPGRYADADPDQVPWYVDPVTRKHTANFDACDSCRLQFSNEIVHWAFIDFVDITQADGGAFPRSMDQLKEAVDKGEPAVGTLASYQSSPGVQRYFCRVCSASVFFSSAKRPSVVDVPVGLLDAEDGARAESFLAWELGDMPTWVEDTKGGWREGFVRRVQDSAEEFRLARGYPKSWVRVKRETGDESS